ncbi:MULTISPECIES: Abi family protein [Pseudomonas]|uniref:Abi family protein n=1 Tax=Pseudomonas TaxID=286 RepID=UPI0021592716|nr:MULTISPECIES: Abi family protein [Pseudomonas]
MQSVSFFRLSPYMRPFQQPEDIDHRFRDGQSWLHTLTTIRNICAHHSRLWNRELGIRPELPKKANFLWPKHLFQPGPHTRIFAALCILNHLTHQVSPDSHWDQRLHQLICDFPDVSLKAMGFPLNWYQDPFWHALEN